MDTHSACSRQGIMTHSDYAAVGVFVLTPRCARIPMEREKRPAAVDRQDS